LSSNVIFGTQSNLDDNDPLCPYTLEVDFLVQKLLVDFLAHASPLFFTFITLAIMIQDIDRPIQNKLKLGVLMVLVGFVFTMIYMVIPVEGKLFKEKMEYVYNTEIEFSGGSFFISFLFFSFVVVYMDK